MLIRQQIDKDIIANFAKKGLTAKVTEDLSTQALEVIVNPFLAEDAVLVC